MTTWKITNLNKKSAVEIQFWIKNGVIIQREEGYRWGEWTCESDERPELDLDNPDGYEVSFSDYDWEMQEMMDGCWADWTFPEDMSEEERTAIEEAWDENWYEGLEALGWQNNDAEQHIFGPIKLINLDTGEEWEGIQQ